MGSWRRLWDTGMDCQPPCVLAGVYPALVCYGRGLQVGYRYSEENIQRVEVLCVWGVKSRRSGPVAEGSRANNGAEERGEEVLGHSELTDR